MPKSRRAADERPPSRVPQLVAIVLLAIVALVSTVQRAMSNDGIDFYNLWGVSQAVRAAGGELGTPYTNGSRFLEVLQSRAVDAGDPKLASAAARWAAPDFTGTPLIYVAFSAFGSSYSRALGFYQAIQVVAFLTAFLLLSRLYGIDPLVSASLALVSTIAFQPVISDLHVANVGCVQLVSLSALLLWTHRLMAMQEGRARSAMIAILLSTLAVLTLMKPNVVLITGALALHVVARYGRRPVLRVAPAVVGVALTCVAIPCFYFGSSGVWMEWFQRVYGADHLALVRPVSDGNYSSVAMLSSWTGIGISATALGEASVLAVSLLWAVKRIIERLAESPDLAVALGVAVTMAVSPLLWVHYQVLMLIPCMWLLSKRFESPQPARFAAIALILSSGSVGLLGASFGYSEIMPLTTAVSWVPLWGAIVVAARLTHGRRPAHGQHLNVTS